MTERATLGLGCYFAKPVDSPERIVRAAAEAGIQIFDTSPAYGESELQVGSALSEFSRESLSYWTKTKALTPNEFFESINASLRRLRVDYVDAMLGHSFIDSVAELEAHRSVFETMRAYKHNGSIKYIGASGHSVEAANKAIDELAIDIIMVPHSISHRRFDATISRARQAGIVVVTMKNFVSGILLGGFMQNTFNAHVALQDIVSFSAHSADVIIPAARSIAQLHEVIRAHDFAQQLSDDRVLELEQQISDALGERFCRSCNECRPCVKWGWQMSQSGILRAMLYHEKFGIDMSSAYASYKLNVLDCEGCDSLCSATCAHGIDVKSEMARAHALFTSGARETLWTS